MCSILNICVFCSVIPYFIPSAYGSEPIDLDNMEHLENLENLAFPENQHDTMPYQHEVSPPQHHQDQSQKYPDYGPVQYEKQHNNYIPNMQIPYENYQANQNFHANQQYQTNQQPKQIENNNEQGALVMKDKQKIVINGDKQNTPTVPIIINHGHGHLKHLSDIIIHDQKCGSPTRIKETKHGLFGLFHKSHIIIIGKDCKDDHTKMVPVFAPKLTAPIHLHQEPSVHQVSHYTNDIDWPDEHGDEHWSADVDISSEHGAPSAFNGKSYQTQIAHRGGHKGATLSHNYMTTPHSDVPDHFESEHLLSESKTSMRSLF